MTASRLKRVPSWRRCGPPPGPAPNPVRYEARCPHGKLGGRYRKQDMVNPAKTRQTLSYRQDEWA
jgi:hypothetical protein